MWATGERQGNNHYLELKYVYMRSFNASMKNGTILKRYKLVFMAAEQLFGEQINADKNPTGFGGR